MGLWAGIVAGALVPLAVVPRIAVAVLLGIAVAGAFRLRPRDGAALYRLWGRAARLYAKVVRRVLLMLCHAVISLAGLAGTSLVLARPAANRSLWHARETLPTSAYGSQFEAAGPGWTGRPWRALVDWAVRSRNVWLIALVPFLVILSLLETEEESRYPAGIYTLF